MGRDGAHANGAGPHAIEAGGLTKEYRLGEHRSLQQTVRHLTFGGGFEGPSLAVLSDLDLEIARGQAFGIVGGNGSGKSTLLQLISGITLPTDGWLTVRGQVLPLLAVGQGFHPELTGKENVMLFGATLGVPRPVIRDRMDEVAEFADIELHMDTPVKRFSSGMLSRLSFATVILFPADIYLFDEVLAVVDEEFQERCLREIHKLSHEGKTVIFISHNLEQVANLCTRVMWLESGRMKQVGGPKEVLDAYAKSAHAAAG
jgi:ABC-type polysaccharide/polyol phosphate transport system ATPase subunit